MIIFKTFYYYYCRLVSPLAVVIFNYGVTIVKLIVHGFATILSWFSIIVATCDYILSRKLKKKRFLIYCL